MLTRRTFIASAAAGLAAPLMPRRVWATNTLTLGDVRIDLGGLSLNTRSGHESRFGPPLTYGARQHASS